MPKPNQLSFVASTDQRLRLERLSAESGRSVAALVREAVAQYLDPVAAPLPAASLWSILRSPENWLEFKKIAAEMEAKTAPPPAEPDPPRPTYRHRRAEGVAPRTPPPPEDEKPF